MKKLPLVSIIIPCYNDEAYVEQAVESALAQTYVNKEIIIVDDGSNVRTKKRLKDLETKISRLITQENKGAGAARNTGIKNCSGDLILNHDSDDFFEATFCAKAVEAFQSSEMIKIVTCHTERFNDKGTIDHLKLNTSSIEDFIKYNCAMGSSMFLKKDWLSVGKYDESRLLNGYEDWEFFIRLLKGGGISYAISEILFHYRIKEISNSSQAHYRKYKILRYIYNKHRKLYQKYDDVLIDHLLKRMEIAEISERKNSNKLEYKIGHLVLSPLRCFKRFLKRYGKP